jgi:hypothetical protein
MQERCPGTRSVSLQSGEYTPHSGLRDSGLTIEDTRIPFCADTSAFCVKFFLAAYFYATQEFVSNSSDRSSPRSQPPL